MEVSGFGVPGEFVIEPRGKRVELLRERFVAGLQTTATGTEVTWLRTCYAEDPETEGDVQQVIAAVRDGDPAGMNIKQLAAACKGFFDEKELRRLLRLAERREPPALLRGSEAHNRFVYRLPAHKAGKTVQTDQAEQESGQLGQNSIKVEVDHAGT